MADAGGKPAVGGLAGDGAPVQVVPDKEEDLWWADAAAYAYAKYDLEEQRRLADATECECKHCYKTRARCGTGAVADDSE